MSSDTISENFESSVSASRLFKAIVIDWHNLGPKILPEIIASASAVELEEGVGSVRTLNFTSAMPFPYVKERLDFLDEENFEGKSSLVEAAILGTKFESVCTHNKFEPKSDGGCVVKVVVTYKAVPGVSVAEEIEKAKEETVGSIRAAEAYLIANPTAYV